MKSWGQLNQELHEATSPGQTTILSDEFGELAVLAGLLRQNSHLSDRPSKSVPVRDETPLVQVREMHEQSVATRKGFVAAVWAAHEAGFSNLRISCECHMTEAGIRMLLKRTRSPR